MNNYMETNYSAFKELIQIYSEITIERIIEEFSSMPTGMDVMYNITGFANCHTCILCTYFTNNNLYKCNKLVICDNCLYTIITKQKCYCHDTYGDMQHAKNAESLYKAIKNRIVYMKKIINEYEKNYL